MVAAVMVGMEMDVIDATLVKLAVKDGMVVSGIGGGGAIGTGSSPPLPAPLLLLLCPLVPAVNSLQLRSVQHVGELS